MNTWIGRRENSYNKTATNKYRENGRIRKTPFGNCHSNNQFRQEVSVDASNNGLKFDETQDIYLVFKYLPTK